MCQLQGSGAACARNGNCSVPDTDDNLFKGLFACDNCHDYAQGKPTVGDSMTWKASK